MTNKTFSLNSNYLEYMSWRVSFRGLSNRRKSLVLVSLYSSPLTARQLYIDIGDCSYSSFRGSITRLRKLRYIKVKHYSYKGAIYSIATKGLRFLYAASKLAPLNEWLAEARAESSARFKRMSKQSKNKHIKY